MVEGSELLTLEGYWEYYYKIKGDRTDAVVWAEIEGRLWDLFGVSRYSSIRSFWKAKYKYAKSKQGR